MTKLSEAQTILTALGFPKAQQNERSAYTLLALCGIKPKDKWTDATSQCMSVVGNKLKAKYPGIMRFIAQYYKKEYAENSRETFRRQTLHQFVQAGLVLHNPDNPNLATNSKDNHYCLSPEGLRVVSSFKTEHWKKNLKEYKENLGTLQEKYSSKRDIKKQSIKLDNGLELSFSPGKHNRLQIDIIQEFASRFAKGAKLLYVGDTAKKDLYVDKESLESINIELGQHSKLPDVVLFDPSRNWLFLIEAVTSHGPMSPKRIIELQELLKNCSFGKVYVTAFPDLTTFKKYSSEIAWETEVWIAEKELYALMIHFNGDRFIGPR